MKTRIKLLLVMAATASLVSGCGANREAPAAFIRHADVICTRFRHASANFEGIANHPHPGFVHRVGVKVEFLAKTGREAVRALRQLDPPERYEGAFEGFLDFSQRRFDLAATAGRAYANWNPEAAELMNGDGHRLERLQRRAAERIPFRVCGRNIRSSR